MFIPFVLLTLCEWLVVILTVVNAHYRIIGHLLRKNREAEQHLLIIRNKNTNKSKYLVKYVKDHFILSNNLYDRYDGSFKP
jgi:hypothetical protein